MNINDFMNGWYSSLSDLESELNEAGFNVIESNGEYIACWGSDDEEDIQYILHLGGTERTIIVTRIETYVF